MGRPSRRTLILSFWRRESLEHDTAGTAELAEPTVLSTTGCDDGHACVHDDFA